MFLFATLLGSQIIRNNVNKPQSLSLHHCNKMFMKERMYLKLILMNKLESKKQCRVCQYPTFQIISPVHQLNAQTQMMYQFKNPIMTKHNSSERSDLNSRSSKQHKAQLEFNMDLASSGCLKLYRKGLVREQRAGFAICDCRDNLIFQPNGKPHYIIDDSSLIWSKYECFYPIDK